MAIDIKNLFEVVQQIGKQPFIDYVDNWVKDNITNNSNSYSEMFRKGFVFKQFKGLEDAFNQMEKIRNKTYKQSYERTALEQVVGSQFKDFKTYTDYINAPNTQFDNVKESSKVIIENIKTLINLGGLFANDRIIVTEDDRGVFDFGLASLGLYRPVEFFSKELEADIKKGLIKNPFAFAGLEAGVVNPDLVSKSVIGNLTFFNFNLESKKYECEKRQRGATKVFNNFSKECFLKSNADGIILTYYLNDKNKVYNGKEDIRLKYASSNKKSYLIYNKKDDSVRNVDIFVPINVAGHGDGSRIVAILPAYLIAVALEEFGIQTRINALRLGTDYGTHVTISLPVKDYNENAQESFNKTFTLLGLISSAESFIGFHKIINTMEGVQAPSSGRDIYTFSDVKYSQQQYINNMMSRYKNWVRENKDKPFVNTKVINENFQFGIRTESGQYKWEDLKYEDILENLHLIFFKFYYYMDFLALEMLNMDKFVKSVYIRFTEDATFKKIYELPATKTGLKDLIRNYIIGMLVEKYNIVKGGAYADTDAQARTKQETFIQKVTKLNESLNNI